MTNKFILFVALLLSYCYALAQDPSKLLRTDLIPASPTAASIAKAGEVPVNLSTGLPSLNIPIFNMQGNDLSLPVSLNYNYDGFKPAQQSSWIGLGWSLDAGGVITRTIHGKVDETSGSGDFDSPFVKSQVNNFTISQEFLRGVSQGIYDAEPDVYNFSFSGYSGKFVKYGNKYYIMPNQKLKVIGGGASFTIITENGTKYFFRETEYTEPKGQSGVSYNIPSYISAWYLTRIENAASTEAINLTYTSEGKLSNAGAFTQSYKKPFSTQDGGVADPTSSFPTYVYPKRLSAIFTDKYTMTFTASHDRLDVNQSAGGSVKSLNAINVTSNIGGFSKSFKLDQSYFGSRFKVYLRLNALKDYVNPKEEDPPVPGDTLTHRFDYVDMPNPPSRNHAFVDHYGFYKGGEFSNMLIPTNYHSNGVNRDPDLTATKQGALLQVTYPSGGNTHFEYELNKSFNGENYVNTPFYCEAAVIRPANTQTGNYNGYGNQQITISEAQNVSVYLVRTARSPYADNFTRNLEQDFVITNASNLVVFQGINGLESESAGKTYTTYLQPGIYNLKVTADSRELSMSALVTYTGVSNTPIEGKVSGGLRIKKMITNPKIGHPIKKEFSYTSAEGFSSGFGPSDTYSQRAWKDIYCRPNGYFEEDYTIISSTISESYGSGVQHYYKSVLEKQIAGQDTLFTRNDFQSYNEYFMGISPVKVTQYKKNVNGLLTPALVKEYEYAIVTDTLFSAIRVYQNMVVIFEGCNGYSGPLEGYGFNSYGYTQAWKYLKSTKSDHYEGNMLISAKVDNIYNTDHNLEMVKNTNSDGKIKITKYKYPESYVTAISSNFLNAHVLSPIFEQQVWSKTGADSVLVNGEINEFSPLVFKPTKQYTLELGGLPLPNNEIMNGGKFANLLSDNRYFPRITFDYSNLGRLTGQHIQNGASTGYKWGFSKLLQNYVIAESKNASSTESFVENFEENPYSASSNPHTGVGCFIGDYSTSWIVPNNRAYTISFFYREGTIWNYKQQDYFGPTTLSDGEAIDDVAIYPKDAQLNSYIYDPGFGVSAVIDTKGLTTYYTYDLFSRPLAVIDQNRNLVKNYKYSYGVGGYFSTEVSGSFVKNNCTAGMRGLPLIYTVPAGSFVSQTSQQDADNQAAAALAANGQNYANSNGQCKPMVQFSIVNNTNLNYPGGQHSAEITTVFFNDYNGTLIYAFSGANLSSFSVPQGNYRIELIIDGSTYNVQNNTGWGRWEVSSANGAVGKSYNDSFPYRINDVNLNGIATATINLNGGLNYVE